MLYIIQFNFHSIRSINIFHIFILSLMLLILNFLFIKMFIYYIYNICIKTNQTNQCKLLILYLSVVTDLMLRRSICKSSVTCSICLFDYIFAQIYLININKIIFIIINVIIIIIIMNDKNWIRIIPYIEFLSFRSFKKSFQYSLLPFNVISFPIIIKPNSIENK